MWKYLEPLTALLDPHDRYILCEFPIDPSFADVNRYLEEVERHLRQGLFTENPTDGPKCISGIQSELKFLQLHLAYMWSTEFSAEICDSGMRRILPLSLLEDDRLKIDRDWTHAEFGAIDLYKIEAHSHYIDPQHSDYRMRQPSIQARAPRLLSIENLHKYAVQKAAPDSRAAVLRSYEIIRDQRLLEFLPSRIDSAHPGKLFAKPKLQRRATPGPTSNREVTKKVLLSLVKPGFETRKLVHVRQDIIVEYERRKLGPISADSVDNHLQALEFWEPGKRWNMKKIESELVAFDGKI